MILFVSVCRLLHNSVVMLCALKICHLLGANFSKACRAGRSQFWLAGRSPDLKVVVFQIIKDPIWLLLFAKVAKASSDHWSLHWCSPKLTMTASGTCRRIGNTCPSKVGNVIVKSGSLFSWTNTPGRNLTEVFPISEKNCIYSIVLPRPR